LLLVHDLLLAKKGIALPATHGLRAAVERHKARLQAEFTKARIARKLSSVEALKQYVESGEESGSTEPPHPRWIRINVLKTQLEDQLETTFANYERVGTVSAVRQHGLSRLYLDEHVPNLIAIPASIDLTKSEAYTSGAIIFQDKASCFPAYMLDPLPEDGDIIDACAAPGNKTTHLAAILQGHAPDLEGRPQNIHAFEKNKTRAQTLKKMVALAGFQDKAEIYPGRDFLKVDPTAPQYRNVGALLLDPSCSGSGIIGRDGMPELHLPSTGSSTDATKDKGKSKPTKKETLKRKRGNEKEAEPLDMIDDDGVITPMASEKDLRSRLQALAAFQLSLLLHAFSFPSAHKITYSTCSIHSTENEAVVLQALQSKIAKDRGWRILRRDDQVRGLRDWPVRGDREACETENVENAALIADACIRANKGDEYGTMGFFLAGFVRDRGVSETEKPGGLLRDERGFIMRDQMGMPVGRGVSEVIPEETNKAPDRAVGGGGDPAGILRDKRGFIVRDAMGIPVMVAPGVAMQRMEDEDEEWNGFDDNDEDDDGDGDDHDDHGNADEADDA
jgi:putative methyltransferase